MVRSEVCLFCPRARAGEGEVMNARFPHPSGRKAAAEPVPGDDVCAPAAPVALADRACCCPSRPVVLVIMPPNAARPQETELLLCGHHYRASRRALEGARATVRELPAKAH
jgi:hypothetical protein